MADAEAIGRARRQYISKDASGADASRNGSERKDIPKDAAHDSKLKSPRRTKGESA